MSVVNPGGSGFTPAEELWLPSGVKAETYPFVRAHADAVDLPNTNFTSGRLHLAGGVVLRAGVQYSSISVITGGTAAGTPLNQWMCLVDTSLNVLAKTTDDTTTAWATNTRKTLNLSTPYTPAADTPVYVGLVVVATTLPTMRGVVAGSAAMVTAHGAPYAAATSTTALTNPATLGATAAALTAATAQLYAQVS